MSRTILHFTDSDQFGGTERALLQVLGGLDRSRWRPVLLHRPESGLAPLLQEARHLGVELRTVPQLRGAQGWARLPALVQQIRRERAAVFHAHLTWPERRWHADDRVVRRARIQREPGLMRGEGVTPTRRAALIEDRHDVRRERWRRHEVIRRAAGRIHGRLEVDTA